MEPGLKRARGQPQNMVQPNAWSRMVRKLMALVIRMNYYLENMIQGHENNRRLVKKLVNNLNMADLIFARELINAQIHKMQLEYDEEDSGSFSVISSPRRNRKNMPQSSASYRPDQRPTSSSAAPMEMSLMTQGSGEAKVGDVHGLSVIFGDNPTCHCGLMGRLHLAQTEGPNFDQTFYRCPRPTGHQWTNQIKDKDELQCTRPAKTRLGSNGIEDRETCTIYRKVLKREPRLLAAAKAKGKTEATSTVSADEMAEFQKFLAWRRENGN